MYITAQIHTYSYLSFVLYHVVFSFFSLSLVLSIPTFLSLVGHVWTKSEQVTPTSNINLRRVRVSLLKFYLMACVYVGVQTGAVKSLYVWICLCVCVIESMLACCFSRFFPLAPSRCVCGCRCMCLCLVGCCESVAAATENRHSNSTSSRRPQPLSREQSLTQSNLLSSVCVCVYMHCMCVYVG